MDRVLASIKRAQSHLNDILGYPRVNRGMRFPKFVMEDVLVILIFMVAFCVLVFFFPQLIVFGDAEVPADPFNTPEHIKPEWYFLASYQFLKIIPSEFGALILMSIAALLFVLLPFVDRGEENNILKRPIFLTLVLVCIIGFVGLTVWGFLS
jgi:ubiquinol-cytochrome c reductase cytochrome b subunit